MMEFRFDNAIRLDDRDNFYILCPPLSETGATMTDVRDKVIGATGSNRAGVWATIGWADNSQVQWDGMLEMSKAGDGVRSNVPEEPTSEEAKLIRDVYPGTNGIDDVRERFINFDLSDLKKRVKIKGIPAEELHDPSFHEGDAEERKFEKDIPYLRLTLFLNPDESAVVYYQYHAGDRKSKEDAHEYIQPEHTEERQRDRLSYLFPMVPSHNNRKKGFFRKKKRRFNFVVKVLTFKRDMSDILEKIDDGLVMRNNKVITPAEFRNLPHHEQQQVIEDEFSLNSVSRFSEKVHTGKGDRYKFMIYNPNHSFIQDRPDLTKKTLMLLHGTFTDTVGSFNELHENGWFKSILDKGMYEQIVGFDHRTVIHGLDTNEEHFFDLMGHNNKFDLPVDIMTTSRGGLLLKQFMTSPKAAEALKLEKAVTMACSNGVGLLRVLQASRYLTFMRYFIPINAVISALAHHSSKFVLNLPGLSCQRIDRMDDFLGRPLATPGPMTILPVIGDYKPRKNKKQEKFFRRLKERLIEGLISIIYGPKHDWVVQSNRQKLTKPAQSPSSVGDVANPIEHTFNSKHSDYLTHPEVRAYIETFLLQEL